jgi:hypothetical protein
VYSQVPRSAIIEALTYIRNLYRRIEPSSESELRAFERREAATADLLSNLPRISEHPTLRTLLEIAEIYSLTLEGAHRLFGYDLQKFSEYDLHLNGSRTRIVESYPFERDLLIDLPLRLAPREAFARDAFLHDLVVEWQTGFPIKVLEQESWSKRGAFYVHVGTEDSLGSSIPPGAMALVEPIDQNEASRPNPRRIYLLQFGNGYRCSHCVATRGRLHLFTSGRTYLGREEFFPYPGSVRIAGRVRMFAVSLPVPDYPLLHVLPRTERYAELILPWEQSSRDRLLATKHRRFRRSKEQERLVQDFLKAELGAKLSGRSERRYRSPTQSAPHVNALLHLTLAHVARYTDSLRADGSFRSDEGRFSLESLLTAGRIEDLLVQSRSPHAPVPSDVWEQLRKEFVEWPPLLSMRFSPLRQWGGNIIRLAEGSAVSGLNPSIQPGSWMLLEKPLGIPDTRAETAKIGWARSLYLFRRGLENFYGYLDKAGDQYALLSDTGGAAKITFGEDQLFALSRVAGIAVPT